MKINNYLPRIWVYSDQKKLSCAKVTPCEMSLCAHLRPTFMK